MDNWNDIRALEDPLKELPKGEDNPFFLYVSRIGSSPFGEEGKEEGDWLISSNEKSIVEFLKEIFLRELLFAEYCNGDAVPGLQDKSYFDVLSILVEGAGEGEFDSFHGGRKTIEDLLAWSKKEMPLAKAIDSLNAIIEEGDLNLSLKLYAGLPTGLNTIQKESLSRRLDI